MDNIQKPRVITDYEKLSDNIIEQIKLKYPYGYKRNLISFFNKDGKQIKGLRYESDEKIYLIRMNLLQAEEIIEQDDDFDDDGNLIESVKEEYTDKHTDMESLPDPDLDE